MKVMEESRPSSQEPPTVDPFVEPSRIEPISDRTLPDKGTKLFVIFFLLIVPPLGLAIVAVLCWTLLKEFLSA